ncbi:hypothetical protein D3C72_387280 [compost metagenome]
MILNVLNMSLWQIWKKDDKGNDTDVLELEGAKVMYLEEKPEVGDKRRGFFPVEIDAPAELFGSIPETQFPVRCEGEFKLVMREQKNGKKKPVATLTSLTPLNKVPAAPKV